MKILLINSENRLPDGYQPFLAEVVDGYYLERQAAHAMKRMICDAACSGIKLRVFSAYRSVAYQCGLFDEDMNRYVKMGYSNDEAYKKTAQSIALPGSSEHNAGLAVDLSTIEWVGEITEEFEKTDEFRWLYENACRYGYILRYPRGKEHITGITYEPWHYRYVGIPHSVFISRHNITLEEYLRVACCSEHQGYSHESKKV